MTLIMLIEKNLSTIILNIYPRDPSIQEASPNNYITISYNIKIL